MLAEFNELKLHMVQPPSINMPKLEQQIPQDRINIICFPADLWAELWLSEAPTQGPTVELYFLPSEARMTKKCHVYRLQAAA